MGMKELLALRKQKEQLENTDGAKALEVLLNEHLLTSRFDDDGRKKDVFSPSDISDNFCAREWCYLLKNPELRKSWITTDLVKIFDHGHKLHSMIQRYLARMGVLYGNYKCHNCMAGECKATGFMPKVCKLHETQKPNWRYCEVEVRDDEYNIYGHTDGQILIGNKKYVFEFKSAREEVFKKLIEPLEKHKRQAWIYLWTLDKARKKAMAKGMIDYFEAMPFEGVIFWYYNKNSDEIKAFTVKYDEQVLEYIEKVLIPAMKPAMDFFRGDSNEMPPCNCKNKTEANGKKCRVAHLCIGG